MSILINAHGINSASDSSRGALDVATFSTFSLPKILEIQMNDISSEVKPKYYTYITTNPFSSNQTLLLI